MGDVLAPPSRLDADICAILGIDPTGCSAPGRIRDRAHRPTGTVPLLLVAAAVSAIVVAHAVVRQVPADLPDATVDRLVPSAPLPPQSARPQAAPADEATIAPPGPGGARTRVDRAALHAALPPRRDRRQPARAIGRIATGTIRGDSSDTASALSAPAVASDPISQLASAEPVASSPAPVRSTAPPRDSELTAARRESLDLIRSLRRQ